MATREAEILLANGEMTLALIEQSPVPSLLLDGGMRVIAASTTFRNAFAADGEPLTGRHVCQIGRGEWDVAEFRLLLDSTQSTPGKAISSALELGEAEPARRHLVLNARMLDLGPMVPERLLLNVTDVTDACVEARAKDDLLLDKTNALQEAQHRIANNLQIVAGVLMSGVARCGSAETKDYLVDAHSRVMSVVELQRELSVAPSGEVEVQKYLGRLCSGIGSSMIGQDVPITLEMTGDRGIVQPDMAVRLGLVATELVINALKHAFVPGSGGKVLVDYRCGEPGWTLSVTDDGVGMSSCCDRSRPGLGTGIVKALARRLRAAISISDQKPGTCVRLNGSLGFPRPRGGADGGTNGNS